MTCTRNPGHNGERYLCLSHPDFHMPADALIGEGFDADAYVAGLKPHGVDAVAMFASCHYGHCYYPSKIGRMHPRLDFDMFGQVARACREHEMGLVAYHSIFLNTQVATDHPDWAFQAEETGSEAGYDSGRYLRLCVNSPYLEEYFLPIVLETLERYPVNEMLLDTMSGYRPCFCDHCRDKWGRSIPADSQHPDWLEYSNWYRKQFDAFFARVIDEVDRAHPDVWIQFNWQWGMRQADRIPEKVKRLGADMIPLWANYVSRFYASSGRPFFYMTGRFLSGLGDWSSTTQATLRYTAACTVACGGSFYIIDRQLPDGSLAQEVCEAMDAVFPWLQERRHWLLGARALTDTVILWDDRTANGDKNQYYSQPEVRRERLMRYEGMGQAIREQGRHYVACGADRLMEILPEIRLLLMPESSGLDASVLDAIEDWVARGGNVLMTLPPVEEEIDDRLQALAGIRLEGTDGLKYHYAQTLPDRFDTVRCPMWRVIPDDDTLTIVAAGEPLRAGAGGAKFGHGMAPLQGASPWPWATLRPLGKGSVCCIAAPIAACMKQWPHPRLEQRLIRLMDQQAGMGPVWIDTPAQVELGCTRIRNDLVIHLVNQAGRADLGGLFYPVLRCLPEIRDIRVFLSRPAKDLRVLHIPDQVPVRIEQIDDAASFIAHPLTDLESYVVPDWFLGD